MTLPSDDEIQAFYRAWFQENFCVPPAAKAGVAVTQAIRAALVHFGPRLSDESSQP